MAHKMGAGSTKNTRDSNDLEPITIIVDLYLTNIIFLDTL